MKIATEIWWRLAAIRVPGEVMQAVAVIIGKTYGFNKKWDMISLSQFQEATGISKRNVIRALKKAQTMNLVVKKDTPGVKKDNTGIPSYCFQKNYELWEPLSKRTPVSKRTTRGVKNDNASLSKRTPTIDNTTKDTITKDTPPTPPSGGPAQTFVDKYHEICVGFPKCRIINRSREKKINARMKELACARIAVEDYLAKVAASDFLRNGNDRWKGADLDFVVGAENMPKILDGKYDNREQDFKHGSRTLHGPPGFDY